MDLNPEDWRRCTHCAFKLVRITSPRQLSRHLGHRMVYAEGLHINEYLRVLFGFL